MKQISVIPVIGDRGLHVETIQLKLKELGFNFGNVDGSFGNQTKKALSHFQAVNNIDDEGTITNETLRLLEIEVVVDLDNNPFIGISSIVDQSRISKSRWENGNRGLAPYGYYYGMGLMYATLYERLKKNDSFAKSISRDLGNNVNSDALLRFKEVLKEDSDNDLSNENDRLRGLMVLMFGLGLMESNGKYCSGWDRGKLKGWGNPRRKIEPTSVNSEAGLFQTSYDIINSVGSATQIKLFEIFERYKLSEDGYRHYFSKGVSCSETNLENFGDGPGKEFQKLSKECPGFTVEFTALALRNIATHWNPVIKIGDDDKGLQIKSECDNLLKKIQNYVDSNIELSPMIVALNEVALNETITLKQTALQIADTLGQKVKLEELFNYAPDSRANFWAIVDFTKPSSEKRLFIFDLINKDVKTYFVSHGKNSGNSFATNFSNEIGSNKSCLGIFKTGTTYIGNNGRSLYLDGLQQTNDNTRKRYIVIHQADYVTDKIAGSSLGCFTVSPENGKEVIDKLRDGSYLLAWKG